VAAAHPPGVAEQVRALQVVVGLAVGPVGRHRVAVEAEAVAVAPRVRSAAPAVRPDVDGSPRSSGAKSLTRWRRRRLVAYASSKATGRRFGSPGERH
jgi:hypothetical protein